MRSLCRLSPCCSGGPSVLRSTIPSSGASSDYRSARGCLPFRARIGVRESIVARRRTRDRSKPETEIRGRALSAFCARSRSWIGHRGKRLCRRAMGTRPSAICCEIVFRWHNLSGAGRRWTGIGYVLLGRLLGFVNRRPRTAAALTYLGASVRLEFDCRPMRLQSIVLGRRSFEAYYQ